MTTGYVTRNAVSGIASRFYVSLLDTTGTVVAVFDSWLSLEYGKEINGVGYYAVTFADTNDPRFDLFKLDYIVEIYRSIPGSGVDWHLDFIGFHRKPNRKITKEGVATFVSTGPGNNSFLDRKSIGYQAGTIQADKSDAAETVMKEYVDENIGNLATIANGRKANGTMTGVSVDIDSGNGALWEGKRAYAKLLDTLQDIANYAQIDFNMEYNGPAKFLFKTYISQLGVDRTTTGLNTTTGKNASGNAPVILSPERGNVQEYEYYEDRLGEKNVIIVLGKGDGATRDVNVVLDPVSTVESPWNAIETVVNATNQDYQYQRIIVGYENLVAMAKIENLTFKPLQQERCLYGLHYFMGDRLTIQHFTLSRNKRLVAVRHTIANSQEAIETAFADVP
jgi:hypothetical protein